MNRVQLESRHGLHEDQPGLQHCYAQRMAERLQAMGQPNYANGFALTLQPPMLERPLGWKKPQTIFVNSMSDLLHDDVPVEFIRRVFDVMARAHWHRFQVLRKRAERLAAIGCDLTWPSNVWKGVSVENDRYRNRVDCLRATPARTRFPSLEPLLAPIHGLNLSSIDWVIVGGESGPGARPMREEWATDLRDQCARAGVPLFSSSGAAATRRRPGGLVQCFLSSASK